jgi:hypothetical protein
MGIKLLLLVLVLSFAKVSARIGISWADDVEPRRLRSVDDLTSQVFEELHRLHMTGAAASLQLPNSARRIHRIVVEGSANEGEDFDHEARGRALKALNDGSDRLLEGLSDQQKDMARRALESGDSRELISKGTVGIVILTAFVIFLVVLIITKLINDGTTGEDVIDFLDKDEGFFKGTPGVNYKNIFPCNKIPLQLTANQGETEPPSFSYLSITRGLLASLSDPEDDVLGFFQELFDLDALLGKSSAAGTEICLKEGECTVTSECCKKEDFVVNCNDDTGRCESMPAGIDAGGFSVEPFCVLWSESDESVATAIDTFAFVPATKWPPVVPLAVVGSLLPLCAPPGKKLPSGNECKLCDFYRGFEIKQFLVGPVLFQSTIQFGGVAFSWADKSKLAFGTNLATAGKITIWDGFLNVVSLAVLLVYSCWFSARALRPRTNPATTTVPFCQFLDCP